MFFLFYFFVFFVRFFFLGGVGGGGVGWGVGGLGDGDHFQKLYYFFGGGSVNILGIFLGIDWPFAGFFFVFVLFYFLFFLGGCGVGGGGGVITFKTDYFLGVCQYSRYFFGGIVRIQVRTLC